MKNFHLNTRVRLGEDPLEPLAQYASETVFIITDSFLATTGHFHDVLDRLGPVAIFDRVIPNPTAAVVTGAVVEYMRSGAGTILAYGGGSVLDTAKAVHKVAIDAGNRAVGGIIAIPTTSGSGSEVTSYAVITDDVTHTKVAMASPDMVATLAILDTEAVRGVPRKTTADSGMDVLTHAVEAYVATDACDFSDAFVEKAVKLVFGYLQRCYDNGDDLEARSHMHNASTMAAAAFDNAGLGMNHSLAHALGSRFPVAHGRLNAVLLVPVIQFNAENCVRSAERYAALGRLLVPDAVGRAGVSTLVAQIRRLNEGLGIGPRLRDIGVPAAEALDMVDALAEIALHDRCTPTNPVAVRVDQLSDILRHII